MTTETQPSRSDLMVLHTAAKSRREAAPLGSDAYRAACEEVARVEVAIAAAEEPRPGAAPTPR